MSLGLVLERWQSFLFQLFKGKRKRLLKGKEDDKNKNKESFLNATKAVRNLGMDALGLTANKPLWCKNNRDNENNNNNTKPICCRVEIF